MAEPNEDDIAWVCEFTNLDPIINRELVVAALKDKGCDRQAVIGAFYDDEAKFRTTYTWDETHFAGDREGINDSLPAFHIEAPDNTVIHGVSPSSLHPVAPSRPPSRTQSPLSRMADWAAQNSVGSTVPLLNSQEDTDLQKALAESAAMSGVHSPQETGVTSGEPEATSALPLFGPANRETYEPDQWAMVRATPQKQEPSPTGRRRAPGAPAFLRYRKSQGDTYYLNGILTVLHAIPGVRNTFLRLGAPSSTYGQDPEWWQGRYIPAVGQLSQEQQAEGNRFDDEFDDYEAEQTQDFVQELHRVMAFLDETDRAYGTADTFLETRAIKGDWNADVDKAFFSVLLGINHEYILNRLFTIVGMYDVTNLEEPEDSSNYGILDVEFDASLCPGGVHTLYQAVDAVYWADLTGMSADPRDASKMAAILSLGQVHIFRMNVQGTPASRTPFDVPEFFFPDRYTADNREQAFHLQCKLRAVIQAIQESEKIRHQITTYIDETDGVQRNRVTLSEQAILIGQQKLWQLKANDLWRRHEESRGTDAEFDFSLADVEAVDLSGNDEQIVAKAIYAEISVHKKKLVDVEQKLKKLAAEKEACEKLYERLRVRNTVPSTSEQWAPTRRHRLRGVIVSSNITYLCRKEPPPPEEGSSDYVADQWWRISYNDALSDPLSVEKTTLETAQEAAYKEGEGKPILIYVSDASLSEIPEPLSDALRTFVRFDNRRFKQELIEESPREKKRVQAEISPTSPPKRQQRSNSIASVSSNMAAIDEMSDRDMDDVPLLDDDKFDGDEGYSDELGRAIAASYNDAYSNGASSSTNPNATSTNNESYNDSSSVSNNNAVFSGSSSEADVNGLPAKYTTTEISEEVGIHDTQESSQGGALSTEMVQMAIDHPASAGGEQTMELDGIGAKFPTTNIGGAGSSGLDIISGDSGSGIHTESSGATNTDGAEYAAKDSTINGIEPVTAEKSAEDLQLDAKEKKPEVMTMAKPKKPKPQPKPKPRKFQMIADWDNPEGRYVSTSELSKDS